MGGGAPTIVGVTFQAFGHDPPGLWIRNNSGGQPEVGEGHNLMPLVPVNQEWGREGQRPLASNKVQWAGADAKGRRWGNIWGPVEKRKEADKSSGQGEVEKEGQGKKRKRGGGGAQDGKAMRRGACHFGITRIRESFLLNSRPGLGFYFMMI